MTQLGPTASGLFPAPAASFELPALVTDTTYHLRLACANPRDVMSTAVATTPAFLTPHPPVIISVTTPGPVLATTGTSVVDVVGVQVGAFGATVHLSLSNGAFNFTSPPCRVVNASVAVRCTAPPGVGAGHSVVLVVDSVPSVPFPNTTLSYAPPTLQRLDIDAPEGVGTQGGYRVVIWGADFGERLGVGVVPLPPFMGSRTLVR